MCMHLEHACTHDVHMHVLIKRLWLLVLFEEPSVIRHVISGDVPFFPMPANARARARSIYFPF
jgi:hypothetical protein